MPGYGTTVLSTIGGSLSVLADGVAVRKAEGITLDWSTVAAVSGSDATLNDGQVIKVGAKYLRYGQVLCQITASGKWGPYDTGATDGRQTLARGKVAIVNTTWLQDQVGVATDYPDVLEGGLVFKERLLAASTGTATLPAYSALEGVMPLLRYVEA